jgi:membrane-associated protease RseP (regulator of RpoE activity)
VDTVLLFIVGVLALAFFVFLSIGLHELGHLTAAKRFGVKCTEYMIGFGPKLSSKRIGETDYGVKAIPLGGYVRILGMYPPEKASQKARKPSRLSHLVDQARQESVVGLEAGDEDRVFYKLPVHKRIVVMLAGPFTNLLLAFILFAIVLMSVGVQTGSNMVQEVVPCVPTAANPSGAATDARTCAGSATSVAAEAGLAPGSTILAVDGQPTPVWDELKGALQVASGNTTLLVQTPSGGEEELVVDLQPVNTPMLNSLGEPTGETQDRVFLGIRPETTLERQPFTAVPAYMWDLTVQSVGALVGLPIRLYELPVSVVGVGRLGGEIAALDEPPVSVKVASIIGLAASLNLFLFLFNLLPVLPLDGGHVAAAIWESIRRKWASWRGKDDPGVVDTARLLPLTYTVAVLLIGVGVMVIWADLFKPITIGG